jgi:hypothetical protein
MTAWFTSLAEMTEGFTREAYLMRYDNDGHTPPEKRSHSLLSTGARRRAVGEATTGLYPNGIVNILRL